MSKSALGMDTIFRPYNKIFIIEKLHIYLLEVAWIARQNI